MYCVSCFEGAGFRGTDRFVETYSIFFFFLISHSLLLLRYINTFIHKHNRLVCHAFNIMCMQPWHFPELSNCLFSHFVSVSFSYCVHGAKHTQIRQTNNIGLVHFRSHSMQKVYQQHRHTIHTIKDSICSIYSIKMSNKFCESYRFDENNGTLIIPKSIERNGLLCGWRKNKTECIIMNTKSYNVTLNNGNGSIFHMHSYYYYYYFYLEK